MSAEQQRVFDDAVTGLLAQGRRSVDGGSPSYMGEDGMRDAIGHAMLEHAYFPEIELESADSDVVLEAVGLEVTEQNAAFLAELQKIHDQKPEREWADLLCRLAHAYDLDDGAVGVAQEVFHLSGGKVQ